MVSLEEVYRERPSSASGPRIGHHPGMTKTRISAERLLDAPADVVYRCIADYRRHHRPEGFLPPAFSDLTVERGGVGAGTAISFTMTVAGSTRSSSAEISEPEPGRVLVEAGPTVRTVFTVEPEGTRSRVRFDTVIDERGLAGLLTRLFAGRLLGPLYRDELERLERYARANADRIRAELRAPADSA
jgi:hypothetical protein